MSAPTPFELSLSGCRTPDEWQSALERLVPLLYGKHPRLWKTLRALPTEFGTIVGNLQYERELAKDCSLAEALAWLEKHDDKCLDRFRRALAQADQELGREAFLKALRGNS